MERPYMICHILSAINGKITGEFMGTESAREVSAEYARIRSEYKADAWLYGTVTTKEFTQFKKPDYDAGKYAQQDVPEGDFVADKDASLYYVSVDVLGEIGWESGTFHRGGADAHVIEVLTHRTPAAYRAYLRDRGVSYILAGEETLDGAEAARKLYRLFGIDTVLICGGGTVNWTFLQQNVVDELSLLIAPAADGDPNSVTVFEKMTTLPACAPAEFQLKDVERLKGNGVRLVYTVNTGK